MLYNLNKIITTILFIILLPIISYSATLEVFFQYPVEQEVNITGFRLLRDGIVDTDNIPKDVRTFKCPAQTDKKDHTYTMLAFGPDSVSPESTPYIVKWIPPVLVKPTYLKVKTIK